MLVDVHPRESWVEASRPITGPAPLPATWAAVVYHYPGSNVRLPKDFADFCTLIRAMQRVYLANRDYSLGYNFVIAPAGWVVEIRGLDTRNAANNGVPAKSGVANYNGPTVSVLLWTPNQDPATALQLAAASRLHVDIERHVDGRMLRVEGHGDKDATPCPGDGIRPQLAVLRGLITEVRNPPAPTPTPIPPEDDDMPVKCVTRNGGDYWLYNLMSRRPIAYPGPTTPKGGATPEGDMRLAAHLQGLERDGVIFDPARKFKGIPAPVVLDDWDKATFDAAPSG